MSDQDLSPPRRCSCGGVSRVSQKVMSNAGAVVAFRFRCGACGKEFGVTSTGRIAGAVVGMATFGFVGFGGLSQIGVAAVPQGPAIGVGAIGTVLALGFGALAARSIVARVSHPVVPSPKA